MSAAGIDRELFQAKLLDKVAHDLGHIGKGVLKDVMAGSVGKTETGKVRSDDMEIVRQLWDQVAKHVTGSGKAVQEENGRLLGIAYLPIENLESING